MARILPFGDDHRAVERLLPWYAVAQLDGVDRARVDAHLTKCGECRASLTVERRLKAAVADMSPQADADWAALRERLDPTPRVRPGWRSAPAARVAAWGLNRRGVRDARRHPMGIARMLAVPAAAAALAAGLVLAVVPSDRPSLYRTLGAPPAATAGNIIVMFQPDLTEAGLRGVLRRSGARFVDGPTSANAYVLRVPDDQRRAALVSLRAQTVVTLAEPIDAAGAP